MLGFVITASDAAIRAHRDRAMDGFKTLATVARFESESYSILIYKTAFANDYQTVMTDGRVLVACGTVMLKTARGQTAVDLIAWRLSRGEGLGAIYSDLRGPFTLLLVTAALDSISMMTDRDGLMCCYESTQSAVPMISSSLLLLAAMVDAKPDSIGVQEFIHGGACVNDRTLFAGIRRAPKASILTLAAGRSSRRVLWAATVHSPNLPDSDVEIVSKLHDMFTAALDTDLNNFNKSFATDLTAGTDSRTVLSFLLNSGKPLVASTAGAADHVDVECAQKLAKIGGIEHLWQDVKSTIDFDQKLLDECVEYSDGAISPFGLTKQLPYFKLKAERFDMLFGGNGGPLFKDHYWLFEFNQINRTAAPNWGRIARYSLTEGRVNGYLFLAGIDYLEHMRSLFEASTAAITGTNNQKLDFMYYDLKLRSFASGQFSFSNKFMDVYHPMCDGQLVQYSMSIRPAIRLRARLQSELIYKNNKALAWVLTDNLVPCVPDTGAYIFLRLLRVVRYVRAARRKINDFVFNKKQVAKDSRALTFVESIQHTALADGFRDPSKLLLAPYLNLEEVTRLCAATVQGAHSGYVQRLFAVEAILQRVAADVAHLS